MLLYFGLFMLLIATLVIASIALGLGLSFLILSVKRERYGNKPEHYLNEKTNVSSGGFRNPWFWVVSTLAFAFAVFLGWRNGIAIAFAFMSMIVAAYFASRSLAATGRSLQITGATARPFLNIKVKLVKGMSLDKAIIVTEIENTGNLPGDHVTLNCDWYIEENEKTKRCSLELEKPSQSIIFPHDKTESTYLVNSAEDVNKLTESGSRIKVTVNYQNKLTGQNNNTHRTFRIAFATGASSFNMAQTIAIPEEDHWD